MRVPIWWLWRHVTVEGVPGIDLGNLLSGCSASPAYSLVIFDHSLALFRVAICASMSFH